MGAKYLRQAADFWAFRAVLIFFFAAVLVCPVCRAGETNADFRLGGLRFYFANGPSLKERLPTTDLLKPSATSIQFFKKCGGIAFSQLATNKGSLAFSSLAYDPKRADGERLVVILTDKHKKRCRSVARIFDWQLVPLVLYADSQFDACFTLFANGEDLAPEGDSTWKVAYHSAFENTLLGLRLMQADILVSVADAADLPRLKGEYVLAPGERVPDVRRNLLAYSRLDTWMRDQEDCCDSYLICDQDRMVTYGLAKDGSLELTGNPLWLCWKHSESRAVRRLKAELEIYREIERDRGKLSEEEVKAKYTGDYIRGRFKAIVGSKATQAPEVQILPDFSRRLTSRIEDLGGVNETVYRSLVTTMRYAALLKLAKAQDPGAFRALVRQCSAEAISPGVKTPTVIDYSHERIREAE